MYPFSGTLCVALRPPRLTQSRALPPGKHAVDVAAPAEQLQHALQGGRGVRQHAGDVFEEERRR